MNDVHWGYKLRLIKRAHDLLRDYKTRFIKRK